MKSIKRHKTEDLKEYHQQYYRNHKEELLVSMRDYYQVHKEQIKARIRRYYQNHKEKIRQYRKSHRKEINKYKRQYRQEHIKEVREQGRQWGKRHREQRRNSHQSYRYGLRAKVLEKLGGRCVRCGFSDVRALQIDHVDGGGRGEGLDGGKFLHNVLMDKEGKYQLLCANCNWIKRCENHEHGGRKPWKKSELY